MQEGENEEKTGGKEAQGTTHISWLISLFRKPSLPSLTESMPHSCLQGFDSSINKHWLSSSYELDTQLDPFYKDESHTASIIKEPQTC